MKSHGAGRPATTSVAALLAAIGAVIALAQIEAALERDARFARHEEAALAPLTLEADGDARRPLLQEVGLERLVRDVRHPLPARVTGLVAPAAGIAAGGPAWRHQWPGVYFEARFEGGSVGLAFDDPHNRYRVTLDGGAGPAVLLNRPGRNGLRLSGLGPGPHEVRVDRISESLSGAGTFGGFLVASQDDVRPPPPARERQVEFIGDSDSVGLGNLSERRDCSAEDVFLLTDTQWSFGPQVARHFGADYRLNAASGIALVRDVPGAEPGRTMGSLYGRALLDAAEPARPTGWAPDVVVVALGSNDFPPAPDSPGAQGEAAGFREEFARRYARFLADLRRRYPRAVLISLAWEEYGPDYLAAHEAAWAELRAGGEALLDPLVLPAMARTGCLWHPNLADHEAVSDALIRHIEARPGVWAD